MGIDISSNELLISAAKEFLKKYTEFSVDVNNLEAIDVYAGSEFFSASVMLSPSPSPSPSPTVNVYPSQELATVFFKEFFNLSPAEWKIKYSPKPIDKVVGVFQFLIEVISELFGKIKFGGNIEFLGRHRLGYNCVLYARSHYPNLPEGLWNLRQKRAIINSSTPQVGCVAIMNTGWIGHCGIVESFMGDQSNPGEITIVEANYKRGYISRRTGRPEDLKLIGYFT